MGYLLKFFFPAIILCVISLIVLSSIDPIYFRSQLIYTILAIIAFFIFSRINIEFISRFYAPIYFVSLAILLFVLFAGHASHGAVRWLSFFGVSLQFSELLKPILAICFAQFLVQPGSLTRKFYTSIIALLPVFFLIFKQPDLGSALVYALTFFLSLLVIGFPISYFLTILVPALISLPIVWKFFLKGYQQARLTSFLKLSYDPLGSSYNMIQSIISVGSGGFLGKGFGLGTQSGLHFLPEKHTDFIFAATSEEMGFIGAIILVLVFIYLFWKMFQVIQNLNDGFYKNLSIISFSMIFIEFVLNVGMNIGILPVVGVALPLVSYGGSSLISTFIFLGILSQIAKNESMEKVIEIT